MRSLSLVMSEYSLSGHGQGHVSNFYIVDLENFATASRRYTGDIHNSTIVGLFMTPIRQWKLLERVTVACTSHARTVVRECCKGDDESQWERVKFDPPPPKNPLTDGHQNLCT